MVEKGWISGDFIALSRCHAEAGPIGFEVSRIERHACKLTKARLLRNGLNFFKSLVFCER